MAQQMVFRQVVDAEGKETMVFGPCASIHNASYTKILGKYDGPNAALMHVVSLRKSIHIEYLEFLLQSGADVNAKNKNNSSVLHFAAGCCHPSVVRFFLLRGACVNAVNDDGCSPLHWACMNTSTDNCVDVLLAAGARADVRSSNGTPLHYACRNISVDGKDAARRSGRMFILHFLGVDDEHLASFLNMEDDNQMTALDHMEKTTNTYQGYCCLNVMHAVGARTALQNRLVYLHDYDKHPDGSINIRFDTFMLRHHDKHADDFLQKFNAAGFVSRSNHPEINTSIQTDHLFGDAPICIAARYSVWIPGLMQRLVSMGANTSTRSNVDGQSVFDIIEDLACDESDKDWLPILQGVEDVLQ